jgi:hypothetical protein
VTFTFLLRKAARSCPLHALVQRHGKCSVAWKAGDTTPSTMHNRPPKNNPSITRPLELRKKHIAKADTKQPTPTRSRAA